MKQNLTISIEKALIQKAKILAARQHTSIAAVISDSLRRLATEEAAYQRAKQEALKRLRMGYALGGRQTARRAAAHER